MIKVETRVSGVPTFHAAIHLDLHNPSNVPDLHRRPYELKSPRWLLLLGDCAHQRADAENAGLENSGPKCRGGKRRTGKRGTMWHGVENAGLENAGPLKYGKPNKT